MPESKPTIARGPTLADKLGIPLRKSRLLRKLQQHGLTTPKEMAAAAIGRGCRHYAAFAEGLVTHAPDITQEELAIALLSPSHPYEPQLLRIGSQLLSSPECNPKRLAQLAVEEQCETVLKYIAECGQRTEPELPFWKELLDLLTHVPAANADIISHISRFRSETGMVHPKKPETPKIVWLRPNPNHRDEI